MVETIKVVAEARKSQGSKDSRRLRREGWLPCILNSRTGEPLAVKTRSHELEMILRRHGGENVLLDLEVDGKKPKKTIVKEIQFHSVTGNMLHADLVEVSMTEKMHASIPLQLTGEATGVTDQEGVLEHTLRHLEVECLPADIIDAIQVNVESLNIGDTVTVAEIEVSSKLDVLTPGDAVVASVLAPTKEEEVVVEEVAEELGEGGEPEVIGEKKEGEEGEEGEAAKEPAKAAEGDDKEKKETE